MNTVTPNTSRQFLKQKVKVKSSSNLSHNLIKPPVLSNTELLLFIYPRCRREAEVIFLLTTYKELVDSEAVGKQKELLLGSLRGVLRAKAEQLGRRAVPKVHFPPGWL